MELCVGMLVLALLLSAFFVFVSYFRRSLYLQNHLRSGSHRASDKIELNAYEAKVFEMKSLKIREPYTAFDHSIP